MNAIIIDDQVFEGFKNAYKAAESFFTNLGGSVYFAQWPNNALEKLEENDGDTQISDKIDLAIIDYDFGNDEMTGEELGQLISVKYPYIAMVILTGAGDVGKRYERCQSVIRKGFIDFRDKADFGGFTKDIHAILNEIISLPSFDAKQKHKRETIKRKMSWDGYAFDLKEKHSIGETAQMMLRLLYINQIYQASNEPITNQQLNYGYEDFINSIDQKFDVEINKIFAPKLNKAQKDENAAIWLPKIEAYLDEEFEFNFENWRKIGEKINQDKSKKAKPNSISTYFQPIINPKNSEHNKKSRHLLKLLIEDKKDTLRLVKERFDTIENVVRHFKEEIQIY